MLDATKRVVIEQRKGERRKNYYSLSRVAQLLLFHDSRKVCFGMWVFICATTLLTFHRIDGVQWIQCIGAASLLIGGGTLTDRWLNKKPDAAPQTPAL